MKSNYRASRHQSPGHHQQIQEIIFSIETSASTLRKTMSHLLAKSKIQISCRSRKLKGNSYVYRSVKILTLPLSHAIADLNGHCLFMILLGNEGIVLNLKQTPLIFANWQKYTFQNCISFWQKHCCWTSDLHMKKWRLRKQKLEIDMSKEWTK